MADGMQKDWRALCIAPVVLLELERRPSCASVLTRVPRQRYEESEGRFLLGSWRSYGEEVAIAPPFAIMKKLTPNKVLAVRCSTCAALLGKGASLLLVKPVQNHTATPV